MALTTKMGASPLLYERGSTGISDGAGVLALTTNFVNASGGLAIAIRFSSPVSQTAASLTAYAYMTTKSGSPTDVHAAIFAGASGAMDAQRPDTGSALGTSAAVDVSGDPNGTWTQFVISSVTLVAGATYWLIIYNATASPASNYPTYKTRCNTANMARLLCYTTTDGFTGADGSLVHATSEPVFVMKFDDGSFLGNPYSVVTAHTNNSNDRGNRYRFDTDTVVVGVYNGAGANANMNAIKVFQGATQVASVTLDRSQLSNSGQSIYFDAPVTFAAGVDYDVVYDPSGLMTIGSRLDAGTSPPTDVTDCMPAGLSCVDGATPGSYTEVDGLVALFLLVDNVPLLTGGGGETSHTFIG